MTKQGFLDWVKLQCVANFEEPQHTGDVKTPGELYRWMAAYMDARAIEPSAKDIARATFEGHSPYRMFDTIELADEYFSEMYEMCEVDNGPGHPIVIDEGVLDSLKNNISEFLTEDNDE